MGPRPPGAAPHRPARTHRPGSPGCCWGWWAVRRTTPVSRVVGACLRDARERRMILPQQAAEALGVGPQMILALEDGRRRVRPRVLRTLARLYRYDDTTALQRLLAERPDFHGITRDAAPGHARRIAACTDSASRFRWQATTVLPAPLQTPAYARAVSEPSAARPGAPRPVTATPVFVLDTRVIQRGGDSARLMAEQLDHLLHLLKAGTDIRVVPESHGFLQPPGHLVEITLPGGRVLARPGGSWVDYCASTRLTAAIDTAVAATDPSSSRDALLRAAAAHHAYAGSPTLPDRPERAAHAR
ncbi:Scr1 family TA system antitoxin-like transcriptional regulator [Streptomyces anthocyanicus]|uniref:Scr1 family TA system antitoxin-like transcriptional regulator n=1 Tax=Streptomyces anthocyanicus TaxID=68174 RepID=UPI0037F3E665